MESTDSLRKPASSKLLPALALTIGISLIYIDHVRQKSCLWECASNEGATRQDHKKPKLCHDPSVCKPYHPEFFEADWGPIMSQVNWETMNTTSRSPCWTNHETQSYRCLPGFMVLGVSKAGTTDFYERLTRHPAIFAAKVKEPHWWTRHASPRTFQTYLNRILPQKNVLEFRSKDGIAIEASASTFWDRGYLGKPIKSLSRLLAPEAMSYILGNRTRFAVLVRDPTERMFSSYFYFHGKGFARDKTETYIPPTGQDFHKLCEIAIRDFNQCLQHSPILQCVYSTVRNAKRRPYLAVGMYDVFLDVWWRYFPKNQLLVIRSEEYFSHPKRVLRRVFAFLELEEPSEQLWETILAQPVANSWSKELGIQQDTKLLLDQFYEPYTARLNKLLTLSESQAKTSSS
eukprot:m.83427 g.83427  ORF g.83427 m.83427 type:complete len:402 (+) comp12921_c0_seq3:137-1342(+)